MMINYELPDEFGHFGPYGGRFVADTLYAALEELENFTVLHVMIRFFS